MTTYQSNFTGEHNDEYDSRIESLESQITTIENNLSQYVTLDTDQTNITGEKRFTKAVQCYRYTTNNALPAITLDKPGTHYIGIGADGTSNRVHFGPCSGLSGDAWVATSTFNSNEWYFQGYLTCTNTLNTSGYGIIANHAHNFVHNTNEVTFIPDGYNNTLWFNYDSFGRANNATVTQYCMGNGKHSYASVMASAHNTSSSKFIKENIQLMEAEEAMKILKITPVSFDYIESAGGAKNQFGVIAEDTEEIIPFVVTTSELSIEDKNKEQHMLKGVDYSKFAPYLIKMIQIQQDEINELKKLINNLIK